MGETERKVSYISWHKQQTDDHFVLKVTEHTKQQLHYYWSSQSYFIRIRPLGLQLYFMAYIAVFHLARLFLSLPPCLTLQVHFLSASPSLFLMKLFLFLMLFTIFLHSSHLSPDLLLDLVLVKVGTSIGPFGSLHLWPMNRFERCSSLKTAVHAHVHPLLSSSACFPRLETFHCRQSVLCSLFFSCFCLKAH